jgi:uncharacterized damage-inducible protein DinB
LKETLRRLFEHMQWADATAIQSLHASLGSNGKALEVFSHLVAAEKLWLARINGAGATAVVVWPKQSVDDCAAVSEENHRALTRLLEASKGGDFDRPVTYTTSKGDRFTSALGDILLHLALHGSYHRGQVAAAVRAGGGEPANTDYINFVRSHRKS